MNASDVASARGNTPLHAAAVSEQAEAVELLLALGAPVNLVNNDGHYPVQLASEGTTSHRLLSAAMLLWESHTRPVLDDATLSVAARYDKLHEGLSASDLLRGRTSGARLRSGFRPEELQHRVEVGSPAADDGRVERPQVRVQPIEGARRRVSLAQGVHAAGHVHGLRPRARVRAVRVARH